jgi:hypothetical protein
MAKCWMLIVKFQPCILILPTETIENIFLLVDQLDDLHSLTYVSRLFALIACPVYAKRFGIRITSSSSIVHIQGNSFRALTTWQRSRQFTSIRDKYLYCEIDVDDLKLANAQVRALRNFLSMPFVGRSFNTINISSADGLSPLEILQFIHLYLTPLV